MKTLPRGREDGPSRSSLHVSRAGRVSKKVPRFTEIQAAELRAAACGRWSVREKESVLACLKKFPSVQYSPQTIWKSVGTKPKRQALEFMLRLRRKAAAHSERLRKKQPPILTWFQVADELSWLKDDDDLYMTVVPLLKIMTVESNSTQDKDQASVVQFSKLYKYLRMLHKDDSLPELSPAESVVLLDCFQHLADMLRASDTKAQTKFMMDQYEKFFNLLYFEQEGDAAMREKNSSSSHPKKEKKTSKKKPCRIKLSSSAQKPLMRAELRPKGTRKGAAGKKKAVIRPKDSKEALSGQGPKQDASRGSQTQAGSLDSGPATGRDGGEASRLSSDSGDKGLPGMSQRGDEREAVNNGGLTDEAPGTSAGTASPPPPERDYGGLEPEDPEFLSKFADMFTLGSLNPFEIPSELINIRPKKATVGDSSSDDEDHSRLLGSPRSSAALWRDSPVTRARIPAGRVTSNVVSSDAQDNESSALQHGKDKIAGCVTSNVVPSHAHAQESSTLQHGTDTTAEAATSRAVDQAASVGAVADVNRIARATEDNVGSPINNNTIVQGKNVNESEIAVIVELSSDEQKQDS